MGTRPGRRLPGVHFAGPPVPLRRDGPDRGIELSKPKARPERPAIVNLEADKIRMRIMSR